MTFWEIAWAVVVGLFMFEAVKLIVVTIAAIFGITFRWLTGR